MLIAREDTVKLYVDEDKSLSTAYETDTYFEVLGSIDYGLQSKYGQKMSKNVEYGTGNRMKIGEGLFDTQLWFLKAIIKKIVDDDKIFEGKDEITEGFLRTIDGTIMNNLFNKLRDMYGIGAVSKEEDEELGE